MNMREQQPTPPDPDDAPPPGTETAYHREIRIFTSIGPGILVVKAGLQMLLKMSDLTDTPPIMLSLLREVFGPVPDDYWQRLQHAAELPCPQPNCDCHIQHAELFRVIEHQRELWQRHNADRERQLKAQEQQQPPPTDA